VPGKRAPPRKPWWDHLWSLVAAFLGIAVLAAMHYNFPEVSRASLSMLLGSFGASAVLLYATPEAPLAQPGPLVFGHVLSAVVGVTVRIAVVDTCGAAQCEWLGAAAAVAIAIVVMGLTHTMHPPGGATALLAVIGDPAIKSLGYLYVIIPTAVGALILLLIALAFNNCAPHRRYPQYWNWW